ncbi:hypothetical protein [Hyphomicrobium sp.]|uniref:hypothetical protein n=1 Tax=Hyphomicrobium sp. TaxID=82 RepID=UPI003F721A5E
MKKLFATLALLGALSISAHADDSCQAQAAAKKLHGAAETSFIKKCSSGSKAKCETDAKAKNLHGAAETSFVTKCMKGA